MAAFVGRRNIMGLVEASIPTITNGTLIAATVPIRASAIPARFHWVSIPGLPTADYLANTVSVIRATYAVIGRHAVDAENVIRGGVNALPVGDRAYNAADASVAYVAGIADIRTEAIILGAIRAACHRIWDVTNAGVPLIATETVASTAVTWNAGAMQTVHDPVNNDFTVNEALAWAFVDLTELEHEVCFYLTKFAMAAVPLAGLTLYMTGHHFLDSAKVAHLAVMKQLKAEMRPELKAWFDNRTELVNDMIFHKSIHPIDATFLRAQATSQSVPTSLKQANLGSAAVRLPYIESEIKAADAMIAMIAAVQGPVAEADGLLGAPALVTALALVRQFVTGAPAVAPVAGYPGVVDRATAIGLHLIPTMQRCETVVAYAIGVYEEMLEMANAGRARSSLMEARSLNRIKLAHIPSVASGRAFYQNLMRVQREMAGKGAVAGPNHVIN